jgi:hypothetical protein
MLNTSVKKSSRPSTNPINDVMIAACGCSLTHELASINFQTAYVSTSQKAQCGIACNKQCSRCVHSACIRSDVPRQPLQRYCVNMHACSATTVALAHTHTCTLFAHMHKIQSSQLRTSENTDTICGSCAA